MVKHQVTITLEVGSIYRVTYEDGSVKRFQITGGEPPKANEMNDSGGVCGKVTFSEIFNSFNKIEKIKSSYD